MNCPKCGNEVTIKTSNCDMCGADLTIFRSVYLRSNTYYNKGLEKALVRDLSGAVLMLKKSLEMNKRNTNARNLLGLVFFEMGETVAALSEWVISKHFQQEENDADRFMELIQSSSVKLDSLNQAVKKYNTALDAAKTGNTDLAIIQLKKVVNLNPHFIRGLQLLALIYMKDGDYERARKYLKKADKIDISNTTTLRYLSEINKDISADSTKPKGEKLLSGEKKVGIEPISNYREDKPNIMAWVNLFIGMAVGIAFTFALIVPTAKTNIRQEYEKEKLDYNSNLMVQMAAITSKEKEIEGLNQKISEKEKEISELKLSQNDPNMYNSLFQAIQQYTVLKEGTNTLSEEELLDLAKSLFTMDNAILKNKEAKKVHKIITESVYPQTATLAYNKGKDAFDDQKYEEAETMLLLSYECNSDSDATLYYLGKTYQAIKDYDKAAMYYNKLIEDYPNSSYKEYTRTRLNEMKTE